MSNAIRILAVTGFFLTTLFLWRSFDPSFLFWLFQPAHLTWWGGVVLALVVIGSVWIFRPWCHFLCPFGLVGWLTEKISVFKIGVDYSRCTACGACEKACPTRAMGAILKRDRVIPDCWSCGSCISACPSKAVGLRTGRRAKPASDQSAKFDC